MIKTRKIKRVSPKIKKPTHKAIKTYLDKLWSLCIKARAGYKSELSGNTDKLNAHHLRGKANYALRYSLDNGFCCTGGEHIFGFHHTGRREQYEDKVRAIRGHDIFERIQKLIDVDVKLDVVKYVLLNELERLQVDHSHIKLTALKGK